VSNIETVLETLNDQKFYDPKKYPGFVAEVGKNVAQGDVKLAGKDYFLNHLKGDNTLGRPYELMIASTLDEPAQAGHYIQFGFKDKGIEVDLLEIRGNTKFLHEAKTSPADFQNTADVQKLLMKLEKYCVDNKFTGGFYQCHGTPDPALLAWAKANLKSNLIVIQENIFFK